MVKLVNISISNNASSGIECFISTNNPYHDRSDLRLYKRIIFVALNFTLIVIIKYDNISTLKFSQTIRNENVPPVLFY